MKFLQNWQNFPQNWRKFPNNEDNFPKISWLNNFLSIYEELYTLYFFYTVAYPVVLKRRTHLIRKNILQIDL